MLVTRTARYSCTTRLSVCKLRHDLTIVVDWRLVSDKNIFIQTLIQCRYNIIPYTF